MDTRHERVETEAVDGREVEQRRRKLGLSAEQLGALAGVSRASVRNMERGDGVSELTATRIALALVAAERSTPTAAPGTDASLRAELDELRAVVQGLTSQILAVHEALRKLPGGPEQQPGGLQGLEPQPAKRRSRS